MNLSLLAGNAALKGQLEAQTARRGLSHAYILSGPAGAGKRTLARLLAAAFVCRGQGDKPCLSCPDCRKAMGGIHPDINVIGDDGGDISVARVRALRSDAYIRPNEAGRKVYILENAHTMNASAQNAMLKLLEEGPSYAAFLLLTDNAAALLRTVRSRCETLSLSPVTQAQAEEWLSRRYPDRAREAIVGAARRCEGLLGRAVEELEDAGDAGSQARAAAPELIARLSAGDELAWMEFCVSLEKWDRDSLADLFAEGVLLLRHALVIRAGGDCGEPDPDRRAAAAGAARAMSPRALFSAVDVLEQLRASCAFNAGAGHLAGWLCAALARAAASRVSSAQA